MPKLLVGECYRLETFKGKLFSDIRNEIKDAIRSGLENAGIAYLTLLPPESPKSEHLLMSARRTINTKYGKEKEELRRFFLEPSTHYRALQILKKNEVRKSALQLRYEVGRLFSEIGFLGDSLDLFDEVITGTGPKTDGDPVLYCYAQIGRAVVMQNMGQFNRAFRELEKFERQLNGILSEKVPGADRRGIEYFIYKHKATLIRRRNFRTITHDDENDKKILKLFDSAEAPYDTYYIHFSRGFHYYYTGEFEKAIGEYEECRTMISEAYYHEYYLIHLNLALAYMAKIENFDQDAFQTDVLPHIQRYIESAKTCGNFKDDINQFMIDLILNLEKGISPTGEVYPWVKEKLPLLLRTRENLYCMRKDLNNIRRFFNTQERRGHKQLDLFIESTLEEADSRYRNLAQLLDVAHTIQRDHFAVVLCVDVRGSTALLRSGESEGLKAILNDLRRMISRHLSGHFNDVRNQGDGFQFVKYLTDWDDEKDIDVTEFVNVAVAAANSLIYEIKMRRKRFQIGVGISAGHVVELQNEEDGSFDSVRSYFSGEAAAYANRMCDIARPTGIVICNDAHIKGEGLIGDFRSGKTKGKHDSEMFDVLYSPEVNELSHKLGWDFRYISRSHGVSEKRLFINYGEACKTGCLYCLSGAGAELFHLDRFTREFDTLWEAENVSDHLISLGCINDPLDNNNIQSTMELTKFLLRRFRKENSENVIQIATKCSPRALLDFLNSLQDVGLAKKFCRTRVCVLFSISTLDTETLCSLEPNRNLEIEELELLYDVKKQIIPYVKPFLPGLTRITDVHLMEFLSHFKRVIVGYSYFTPRIMSDLWKYCIKNEYESVSNFYSYYEYTSNTPPLSLSFPGRNGESFVAPNYRKETKQFTDALLDRNEGIKVFGSSPCAVADWRKRTCYTNVGDSSNSFSDILCNGSAEGREKCPNTVCIYNKNFLKRNILDRTRIRLRHMYSHLRDPSHATDHFERVWHLGKEIAKTLGDNVDRKILGLVCLLHDVGDPKQFGTENGNQGEVLEEFMKFEVDKGQLLVDERDRIIKIVLRAAYESSLKKGFEMEDAEGFSEGDKIICQILRDADRIDAIGAIGIARCFAFPKNKGIFNVNETPRSLREMKEQYENPDSRYRSSIIHFFEKLIHTQDSLTLDESRKVAGRRQEYTDEFLKQFLDEYDESQARCESRDDEIKNRLDDLRDKLLHKSWYDPI